MGRFYEGIAALLEASVLGGGPGWGCFRQSSQGMTGSILYVLFILFVVILLLNMLIAMSENGHEMHTRRCIPPPQYSPLPTDTPIHTIPGTYPNVPRLPARPCARVMGAYTMRI